MLPTRDRADVVADGRVRLGELVAELGEALFGGHGGSFVVRVSSSAACRGRRPARSRRCGRRGAPTTSSCRFVQPQAWFGTIGDDLADLGPVGARGEVDEAVLLVERVDARVGVLDDQAVAAAARLLGRVVRQRLRAGVEDAALGRRPAHDRRADPQRAVLERDGAVRDARAVAVDVGAGADLRDLGHLVVREERRRPAGAHRRAPRARAPDRVDRGAEPRPVSGQRRVGHQAVEAQPRQRVASAARSAASSGVCTPVRAKPVSSSTRKPTSVPAAASAGESPRATAAESADDREARLPGERRKPLGLRGADEREREQDVAQPRGLHHLGLAELLAGDPDGAGARPACARSPAACAS